MTKLAATQDGQKKSTTVFSEGGVVAVTVLRHPRSKNMSWLTSDHDFVPYPSDRKNSYDMMVVTPTLMNSHVAEIQIGKKEEKGRSNKAGQMGISLCRPVRPCRICKLITVWRLPFVFRCAHASL